MSPYQQTLLEHLEKNLHRLDTHLWDQGSPDSNTVDYILHMLAMIAEIKSVED